MRARTLFIGTLGLSLAFHALILFAPSWSASKPASQSETYRVELIQKPVRIAGSEEPGPTAISAVTQEKPKPRENPAVPQTAVAIKPQLSGVATGKENDQSTQPGKETSKADSQPQDEVRTVNSAHRTNSRSRGVARGSYQGQPTDYQRILGELSRLLHEHLYYPEIARRKGIEGALAITFTLNTNGDATDVIVSESSGSRILDRAAVRAISDLFPYPDPPDTPLHFTIPVTYRLTESD